MAEQSISSSTELGTAGIAGARAIDRYFQISTRGSTQKYEVVAGTTTFTTMAYAVFVVPGMLGRAGFDISAVFVVVCLTTAFDFLLMGLWTKPPVAIGCAISLTALVALGLVLGQKPSPEVVFGTVFLMGMIFTAILATGVYSRILRDLSSDVARGTGIGIGLFLLLITSNDAGLVVKNVGTGLLVTLDHVTAFPVMMSVLGLVTTFGMECRRVPGGILIVVIAISTLGLILGPAMESTSVFAVPSLTAAEHASLIGIMDTHGTFTVAMLPSVLALVMTVVFDATDMIHIAIGRAGLLNDKGHVINGGRTLTADSISSIFSTFFDGVPAVAYIESTIGVAAGDKTSLTAVAVDLMSLVVMSSSPLTGLMLSYVMTLALMYVSLLILSSMSKLHMDDMVDALSELICVVFIVLTYNIVTGIMLGFNMLAIGRLAAGEQRKLNIDTVAIVVVLVTFYVGGWTI